MTLKPRSTVVVWSTRLGNGELTVNHLFTVMPMEAACSLHLRDSTLAEPVDD